jgi:hypothetical protein
VSDLQPAVVASLQHSAAIHALTYGVLIEGC